MPQTSLDFIDALDLPKFARIIDIGGGDSKLADHLFQGGFGTFSENGPDKCSGLPVKQYLALQLKRVFARYFSPLNCITQNHITPFGTTQDFLFCGFQKQ